MSRFYVSVPLFLLLSLDLLIAKNIPFFKAHRLTAHLIFKASLISKLPLSPPSCNADHLELSKGRFGILASFQGPVSKPL